jgi:hypothetical protein
MFNVRYSSAVRQGLSCLETGLATAREQAGTPQIVLDDAMMPKNLMQLSTAAAIFSVVCDSIPCLACLCVEPLLLVLIG